MAIQHKTKPHSTNSVDFPIGYRQVTCMCQTVRPPNAAAEPAIIRVKGLGPIASLRRNSMSCQMQLLSAIAVTGKAAKQLQTAVQLTVARDYTTYNAAGRVTDAEGLQSGNTMHGPGVPQF